MCKFLLRITILLIIFPFQVDAQKENSSKDTVMPEMYQVKKIKRIRNVYVVYALKDGKQYEIISPKGEKPDNSNKIQKGKKYDFVLLPYFKNNDFSRFTVTHVEINGTIVPLEKDFDNNLYLTTYLSGLYYTNPKK